jgi:hypothetical protein
MADFDFPFHTQTNDFIAQYFRFVVNKFPFGKGRVWTKSKYGVGTQQGKARFK